MNTRSDSAPRTRKSEPAVKKAPTKVPSRKAAAAKPPATAAARTPARRKSPPTGRAAPIRETAPEPVFEALLALRFHPSQPLRTKALRVLDAIDAASHPRGHGEALADLVAELVVAGMDWYFLRPLQRAQVGFMAEQSARLGLNTATKMINSASRGFILRMDLAQLRVVAGYMREIG